MKKHHIHTMEIRTNGTRFEKYIKSDFYKSLRKNPVYDYEKNGILVNLMSSKITSSKNEILQYILNFFEKSILFLIKYTDELKHFKDIHWKNR